MGYMYDAWESQEQLASVFKQVSTAKELMIPGR